MKLRNKITGEIKNAVNIDMYTSSVYLKVSNGEFDNETIEYHSLAELNDEWEDVSTEEVWYLGEIIGNYSMPKKEARKATEKILAWQRLKNTGFKFEGYADRDRANGGDIVIYAHVDIPNNNLLEEAQPAMLKDLDLLFCPEAKNDE